MVDPSSKTSRRRFLTGVVGGGVAVGVGVVATTTLGSMTETPNGGGPVTYRGISNRDGPATRALPQVPIRVDAEGYLHGVWPEQPGQDGIVPTKEFGDVRYSANWFRYCDFADYPGFRPDSDADTYLRSAPDPPYDWQARTYHPGEPLNISDFNDYETWDNDIGKAGLGKPALTVWRWAGSDVPAGTINEDGYWQGSGPTPFHVQVLRSPKVHQLRDQGGAWTRASTSATGFTAWSASCTLNCAMTGFKATRDSEKFEAGDVVYCPHCQSTFSPFEIVTVQFVAPKWNRGNRDA